MSEPVMLAIVGLIGTSFAGWMTYRLAVLAKVTNATHDLVNSASLVQNRLYSAAARRIATLTNDPEDVKVAQEAEKALREHEQRNVKANQAKESKDVLDVRT